MAARAPLFAEVFADGGHDPRGRGQEAMIFVHGWLMDHGVWVPAARHEALRAWTRCCVDLRGHGRSVGEVGATLDEHVEDLLALADRDGLERFVLVGHSMGGAIAQRLAARAAQRVSKLVLVAPVPMGGFPLPPEVKAQFASLAGDRAALEAFLEPQVRDPSQLDLCTDIASACPPATVTRTLEAWTGGGSGDASQDGSPAAPTSPSAIQSPTLVIGGADDGYITPEVLRERVAGAIADAKLDILADCGHYPQVDQPEAVASAIAEFLAS